MAERVSVGNCVSSAAEMLLYSSRSLVENAGTDNFDLVIVTWLATPAVGAAIKLIKDMHADTHVFAYETNEAVGYVPNLRGLINTVFDHCFDLNQYGGLVNTDQYFGRNWLQPLVHYMDPDKIVNSQHITPIKGPHVITADCGVPEAVKFNKNLFERLYLEHVVDGEQDEAERGGWMNTNTLPYLFHRRWWEQCGPWGLEHTPGELPPDRQFFQRCHDAGARFTMAMGSVCYHHEAVERKMPRPRGAEGMSET